MCQKISIFDLGKPYKISFLVKFQVVVFIRNNVKFTKYNDL